MTKKPIFGSKEWAEGPWTVPEGGIDPDDAPELTQEWFDRADIYKGGKLVRRGRPPGPVPKLAVSMRLDADVVQHYRDSGPGWQTRINAALRKAANLV